jgi:hypothetical protein
VTFRSLKRALFAFCIQTIVCGTALATGPCIPMSPENFSKEVLRRTDLAVFAKITDFSSEATNEEQKWTSIEAISVVYPPGNSGIAVPAPLRIEGWQANDLPLYAHEKGGHLVVFLTRKKNGSYEVTNLSWKDCVPATWNANESGKTYPNFRASGQMNWLSIEEASTILRNLP